MGRFLTSQGTLGILTREITTNTSVNANDRLLVNSAVAAVTLTLPATPLINDMIQIIDIGNNCANNKITVVRNGQKIQNLAEDLTIDLSGSVTSLIYTGATYGWVYAAV